jgi:hypothetical protein
MTSIGEYMSCLSELDARDQLAVLRDAAFSLDNRSPDWLFGNSAEFYFRNGNDPVKREAMIRLAQSYYDRCNGAANYLVDDGERGVRLRSRDDIYERLAQGKKREKYFEDIEPFSFYIKDHSKKPEESLWPVHEKFSTRMAMYERLEPSALTYTDRIPNTIEQQNALVLNFIQTCEVLKVFYGAYGLALLYTSYSTPEPAKAYPLYKRFPGLLYANVAGFFLDVEGAKVDISAGTIRDVNWLTAINSAMLTNIGGVSKARAVLGSQVIVHEYDGGAVFQAGARPRTGDVNKNDIPDPYRQVNRLLRPMRFDNWTSPYLRVPAGIDAWEASRAWLTRFDDK